MWNFCLPVFLTKGLGLAISECLLLAANSVVIGCSEEYLHWKETVPYEQPTRLENVTSGLEIFFLFLSAPLPHPLHTLMSPWMKASEMPPLPPHSLIVPFGAKVSQESAEQTDSGQ